MFTRYSKDQSIVKAVTSPLWWQVPATGIQKVSSAVVVVDELVLTLPVWMKHGLSEVRRHEVIKRAETALPCQGS